MQRVGLTDGGTAYEICGAKSRATVILVHGMTSPSIVWEATIPALAAEHEVLRYDLFGRGESDRPRTRYDLALYLRQLDELVAKVVGDGSVVVVGFSWGAGIAAAWSNRHSARVKRLVLVAPGGLDMGLPARLLALPLVGEMATHIAGRQFLDLDLRRCFAEPRAHEAFRARVLAQIDTPGFAYALLSTLRHVPVDLGGYYAALGRHAIPVDVLWGTRDAKVPIRQAHTLVRLVPRARVHPIEGGAHALQVEHAHLFNATLGPLLADP